MVLEDTRGLDSLVGHKHMEVDSLYPLCPAPGLQRPDLFSSLSAESGYAQGKHGTQGPWIQKEESSELGPPAACDLLNEELGNWEAFLYGELPASSRQAWWDDFGHGSGEVL